MFNIDSKPVSFTLCDGGCIIQYEDGSEIKFMEHYTMFKNKYGDRVYDATRCRCFQYIPADRPTYDELYEHWLKTK